MQETGMSDQYYQRSGTIIAARLSIFAPLVWVAIKDDDLFYIRTGYTMNAEGAKGNWWSKKTVAVFHERSRCLIDQYNKFFLETAQLHVRKYCVMAILSEWLINITKFSYCGSTIRNK